MDEIHPNEPKPNLSARWGFFLLTLVSVIVVFVASSGICLLLFSEWNVRGQFGDMFGGVNALFSAVAFAALFCALKFQRDELELQRAELKLTREELKRGGDAQLQSSFALARQAELLRATGELNSVVARIAVYDRQVAEAEREVTRTAPYVGEEHQKARATRDRLQLERSSLEHDLDALLKRFAKSYATENHGLERGPANH